MLYVHIMLGLIFAVLMPIAAMMFMFLRLWTKKNYLDFPASEDAPDVPRTPLSPKGFENLPLMVRPSAGTQVKLLVEDSFLADYAHAHKGDIGIVVGNSRTSRDDRGLMVNWGKGFQDDPDDQSGVRTEMRELALYFEPESKNDH